MLFLLQNNDLKSASTHIVENLIDELPNNLVFLQMKKKCGIC